MGYYFFAYNFVNLLLWLWLLFTAVQHLTTRFYFSLAYQTMDYLRAVQTIAVLEPVHALVLRTSVFNTLLQVFSRLLIVWGPHYFWQTESIRLHWSYSVLVLAWSVAEIIRYSFYTLKEANSLPFAVKWMRYTGFIVLYPLGVSMEVCQLYLVTLQDRSFNWVLYTIMGLYIPGLFILYTHMLKQRSKALTHIKKVEKNK